MDSFKPRRVNALRGKVIQDLYGRGTKSEHEGILIVTDQSRYLLRRKNGPAFNDSEIKKYIGQEVECDGFLMNSTLIAEHIKIVDRK